VKLKAKAKQSASMFSFQDLPLYVLGARGWFYAYLVL